MGTLKIDLPFKGAQDEQNENLSREIMELLLSIEDIDSLMEILPPWIGLIVEKIGQMGLIPEFEEFYRQMVDTAGMDPSEYGGYSEEERVVIAAMSLLTSYHEASWSNNQEALDYLGPEITRFISDPLDVVPAFILRSMRSQLEAILSFEKQMGA
nr:hypothetical protein BdHM001_35610 [Bdellovibrio sp. HM001]